MSVENPFGVEITPEDIIDTLSFFDSWEDKYKYIIDLGKSLPRLDDQYKDEGHLVKGCQSQVWIHSEVIDGAISLQADSDAFIVKGLLGVVLAGYNRKSPKHILEFDIDNYFEEIGLLKHLSPIRGNGMRAMVARIKKIAEMAEA